MKDKSKNGLATNGVKRDGRNEPGPHVVEHKDKNPQLGTPKKLKGFYGEKRSNEIVSPPSREKRIGVSWSQTPSNK